MYMVCLRKCTQYRVLTWTIFVVVGWSIFLVAIASAAQPRSCESSHTDKIEFVEPQGCPYEGEPFRYCTDGTRKNSTCVYNKRNYCVFCEAGKTYSLDQNFCVECITCTKCRDDEIVAENCTVRSDTVCSCPSYPSSTQSPVTAYPQNLTVTAYQCPACPERECPECGILSCPSLLSNTSSCPTLSNSSSLHIQSTDQCIFSLEVEMILLCIVGLLIVIVAILSAFHCKKWKPAKKQKGVGHVESPSAIEMGPQNGVGNSSSKESNEMVSRTGVEDGQGNGEKDSLLKHEGDVKNPTAKESNEIDSKNGVEDSQGNVEKDSLLKHDGESAGFDDLETDAPKDDSPVNHKEILKQNCKKNSLKIRKNVDYGVSGNCFFDATFDQLKRLNLQAEIEKYKTAEGLRQSVCELMENKPQIKINHEIINAKDYIFGKCKDNEKVDKNKLWEDYLRKMKDTDTWAGHLEVNYMHKMLNITIVVIMSSGEDHPDKLISGEEADGQPILLGHRHENHYYSLEPIDKHAETSQQNAVRTSSVVSEKEDHSELRNMNEPATQRDFGDVIRLLGPDDLQELFYALKINVADIEKDEKDADSTNPDIKARKVLIAWRERNYSKMATCQVLLDALEQCGNILAKEILEDNWNGKDNQATPDSKLYKMIGELNTSYLKRLFEELGISEDEVKKVEQKVNTKDIDLIAKAVLRLWKKRNGKKANAERLKHALEETGKKERKKDLQKLQKKQKKQVSKLAIPKRTPRSDSIESPPSTPAGEPNIEILFDDNNGQTALDIADAIIAIMNSSRRGSIKLTNNKGAKSPSLSFTITFEQILKDLDLIQPHDLLLPSFDFSLHDEQIIVIHPSKKKILYLCKDGNEMENLIYSWKSKWGMAYITSPGNIKEIGNTGNLLRILGEVYQSYQVQNVPAIPGAKNIIEGEQLNFVEEKNRVHFIESVGEKDLKSQITEINKYISAFANTVGGLIVLGVTEDGTVKGINFQHIDPTYNADTVRAAICDTIHQGLIWIKKEKEEITILSKRHVEKNFEYKVSNVLSAASKKVATDKKVIFIKVPRLANGVVFTSLPQCPYFNERLQKVLYTGESGEKWCKLTHTYLKKTFPG